MKTFCTISTRNERKNEIDKIFRLTLIETDIFPNMTFYAILTAFFQTHQLFKTSTLLK